MPAYRPCVNSTAARSAARPSIQRLATSETIRPGDGFLQFTRVADQTAVTAARAQSPLKLLCPRAAGPSVWAFASNYGGGLVAGDDIRLRIHTGQRTTALLSTQASTKIYRSRGTLIARQSTYATIDEDALLVVAPDPIACFTGARFEQQQRFHLTATSSLVLIDSLTSGRLARGERWAFSRYRSSNQIFLDDRCIFHDTLLLDPADGPLDHPHRLGRVDCLVMLLLIGPKVLDAATKLLVSISAQLPGLDPTTRLLVSASPLPASGTPIGAVLRVAGAGAEPVARFLRDQLAFLCPMLGDNPWKRKW